MVIATKSVHDRTSKVAVSQQSLKSAVSAWTEHKESKDEALWQQLLSDNVYVLEQVFAWPVNIIQEKAYVGGKSVIT